MALTTELIGSTIHDISPGSAVTVLLGLGVFYFMLDYLQISLSRSPLPLINGRKSFEFSDAKVKERYIANAEALLEEGFEKNKAFYLVTDNGPRLILANAYAREIHANPHLSIPRAIASEMHCYISCMRGYKADYFPEHFGVDAIRTSLRRATDSLLRPLSIETTSLLDSYWKNERQWTRFSLNPVVLDMVAQLTAAVRSGDELAQRPEWRRLSVDFTNHSFMAAKELDLWPLILRPFVHWFMPSFKQLRSDIDEAVSILKPILETRSEKRRVAVENGEEPPRYNDMIDWFDEHANGRPFDATMAQLMIAQAMIHGLADLTTQSVFNLCEREELVQDLRTEIVSVLSNEGLSVASLSNLHLLDSVIKESQRMKPMFLVTMKRYAEQTITLSDGVQIPKDTILMVSTKNMWDASKYEQANEFQGDRFLKRRQVPGQENAAQLASATLDHMGFGFGRHGCPGRFFAANLMKLILCHILLKYDLRLAEGSGKPDAQKVGFTLLAHHSAQIEVRRRQEEIDI